MKVTGGDEVDIASDVLDRAFAVTGKGIYYARSPLASPQLRFLPVNRTESVLLRQLPKPIVYRFTVSPRGLELLLGETDTFGADLELVSVGR